MIIVVISSCQQPENTLSAYSRDAIIKEIKQTTDSIFTAANNRDANNIYNYFSDNTTGVFNGSIMPSWEDHKKQERAYFATLEELNFKLDTISIDVLSPEIAVLFGKMKMTATDTSGKNLNSALAWTYLYHKIEGRWKVVHFHTSEAPLSNPQ